MLSCISINCRKHLEERQELIAEQETDLAASMMKDIESDGAYRTMEAEVQSKEHGEKQKK